jgi:hypothetical protein
VAYDPGTAAPVLGVGALTNNGNTLTYVNPYGLVVTNGPNGTPDVKQPSCD